MFCAIFCRGVTVLIVVFFLDLMNMNKLSDLKGQCVKWWETSHMYHSDSFIYLFNNSKNMNLYKYIHGG